MTSAEFQLLRRRIYHTPTILPWREGIIPERQHGFLRVTPVKPIHDKEGHRSLELGES
jgi:hypothetical protein